MDFRPSDDQEALQQGVRSFCEGRVTTDHLREIESQPKAFDRELWNELAEMGIFSLQVPEEQGGVGLKAADAVLVFEELGRACVPGPVLWSHLAAGHVDGADLGETVVGGLDLTAPTIEPFMIEHLESLDRLILLKPDSVEVVEAGAVEGTSIEVPLDPLTPIHYAKSLPTGEAIGGVELATQMRLMGTTLASGLMLGIAEATLEMANEYAKKREQFDRPIGSFQSIKHMLADSFVRQEAARAAAYAAGATLDFPEVGDVERAVSSAKVVAGDAAMKNSRTCIQVHGGMGYTWEVPAHYFFKRTWVLENVFGGVHEHSDRIADRVAAEA
ncbi:acyl-CoA/acyl-ACP dehydrogenase [Myxococcota bacterium]|nr:acyl-CoA/acyl-ACP dehydrogenase [Myxococcota bacterium]